MKLASLTRKHTIMYFPEFLQKRKLKLPPCKVCNVKTGEAAFSLQQKFTCYKRFYIYQVLVKYLFFIC